MIKNLVRGQKIDLYDIIQGVKNIRFVITPEPQNLTLNAMLLNNSDMLERSSDLIFSGNKESSNKSISVNNKGISVDLQMVPQTIQKIVLVLTSDVSKGLPALELQIIASESPIARFIINHLTKESTLILGELYRYNSKWKFSALASGFSGSLNALCANHGLKVKIHPPKKELSILKHLERIDSYVKNRQRAEYEKNQISLGIIDTSIFGR